LSGRERRGVDEAMRSGTYYFQTSLYHAALSRYFARFGRSAVKVIVFDDFISRTSEVVRDVHRFLDIDSTFVTDVTVKHNPAIVPRSIIANAILSRTVDALLDHLPSFLRGKSLKRGKVVEECVHRPGQNRVRN